MRTYISYFGMLVLLAFTLALVPNLKAEQITREGTITVAGGASNVTQVVNLFNGGVGKAQANEIVKVALYSPSATTTTKVDFAVQEVDTTTFTTVASQDYTAGAYTYLNNAPFYKFVTGVGGASSTNYNFTPYMSKTLRLSLWQNATNSALVTKTYTYQVITR